MNTPRSNALVSAIEQGVPVFQRFAKVVQNAEYGGQPPIKAPVIEELDDMLEILVDARNRFCERMEGTRHCNIEFYIDSDDAICVEGPRFPSPPSRDEIEEAMARR